MSRNLEQLASDNYSGICPEALEYMLKANQGSAPAYGNDEWTQKAADYFRELFEIDCEVFFTFNGTAANSLSLAALCQSYHSVIFDTHRPTSAVILCSMTQLAVTGFLQPQ